MTKLRTAEDLYEDHRRQIQAEQDAQMPPWHSLPEWEKSEWEAIAREAKDEREAPVHPTDS